MQNRKSELHNLVVRTVLPIMMERYSFLEVMEVLTIKDQPLTTFMFQKLKALNGQNQNLKEIPQNQEEDIQLL